MAAYARFEYKSQGIRAPPVSPLIPFFARSLFFCLFTRACAIAYIPTSRLSRRDGTLYPRASAMAAPTCSIFAREYESREPTLRDILTRAAKVSDVLQLFIHVLSASGGRVEPTSLGCFRVASRRATLHSALNTSPASSILHSRSQALGGSSARGAGGGLFAGSPEVLALLQRLRPPRSCLWPPNSPATCTLHSARQKTRAHDLAPSRRLLLSSRFRLWALSRR